MQVEYQNLMIVLKRQHMVKALAESMGENPRNAAVNNSRKRGGDCSLLG